MTPRDPRGFDHRSGWDVQWDYAAKSEAPSKSKSCTIAGDAVNILTGGNATVQLQNKGGKLDGTFQSKGGNSFHVSLTKQ